MGQQQGTAMQSFMSSSGKGKNDPLSALMASYAAPTPNIVNAYEKNLLKPGGIIDAPSFGELYGSYRAVGEKEAARQSANINESFGTSGARYSSGILNAQSKLRENLGTDLDAQASQFMLGLRKQQSDEAGSLGNLQTTIGIDAMQRMFQDFLRRTSPPPLLSGAGGVGQGFGQSTVGVF